MSLPNFFCVGAQKAGTTSLHNYLAGHPDICLPKQKETKFFVEDGLYNKGIEYYESTYFGKCGAKTVIGEVDPDYMYFSKAADRIARHIQNPKFIFIFRNPVDRAFSHYLMTYRRGIETYSFEDAIRAEQDRISRDFYGDFHYSYVNRGYYFSQLKRFLERWDRASMHFILSEDLLNDPVVTVQNCLNFLGLDSNIGQIKVDKRFHEATVPKNMAIVKFISGMSPGLRRVLRCLVPRLAWRNAVREKLSRWNSQPSNLELSPETRRLLVKQFQHENERLAELIGRDLSHWNDSGRRK